MNLITWFGAEKTVPLYIKSSRLQQPHSLTKGQGGAVLLNGVICETPEVGGEGLGSEGGEAHVEMGDRR